MFSLKLTTLLLGIMLYTSRALSAYVTLPLYIDPSNNSWQTLYNAISANPQLTFNLIINPNSGPGEGQFPDSETIEGLATLNAYPNVNTIGYVHVEYCGRSTSDVQSEVNTYAGWAKYTGGKDIHVDGIFFDEAPADYSSSNHAYMQTVTGYVKSAFPSGGNHVTFNPGATADPSYFSLADTICVFENYYSSWSSDKLSTIPADQKAASTIIMYSFDGSADQQHAIVEAISSSGVAGLYITALDGYTDFSPLWSQFVSSIAGTGGSSGGAPAPPASSSSTTTSPSSTVAPKPSTAAPKPQSSKTTTPKPQSSTTTTPKPQSSTTTPKPQSSTAAYEPEPSAAGPEPSSPASEPETSPVAPKPTTLTVVPVPPTTSTTSPAAPATATPTQTYKPHRPHRHWTRPRHRSDDEDS